MRVPSRKGVAILLVALVVTVSALPFMVPIRDTARGDGDLSDDGFPLLCKDVMPGKVLVVNATGLAYEQRLLLASLQGLVNRDGPLVYVDHGGPYDPVWSARLRAYSPDISIVDVDYETALDLLLDRARGCVAYDPDDGMSVNVATSISGIMDLVMVERASLDRLGLPRLYDATVRNGTNTDPVRFYREFRGSANASVLANLDPGDVETRDFIVQNRVIALDVPVGPFTSPSGNRDFGRIYDMFAEGANGRNRVVMGFFDGATQATEDYVIQGLSGRGLVLVPSDRTPNLSFLSYLPGRGVPPDGGAGGAGPVAGPEDRVYVTFGLEDGDNLNFEHSLMDGLFAEGSPLREMPVAWGVSPTMRALCPFYYEHYVESMPPNGSLMDATSGPGVIFPELFPEAMLGRYLDACPGMTGDSAWLVNTFNPYEIRWSPRVLRAYGEVYPSIVLDYGDMPVRTPFWMEGDALVVRTTHFWTDVGNLRAKVELQRELSEGPSFMFVAIYPWHFDKSAFAEYVGELGSDPAFSLVNASTFFALARQAAGDDDRDPPERYTPLGGREPARLTGMSWCLAAISLVVAVVALVSRGIDGTGPRRRSSVLEGLEVALATALLLVGTVHLVFGNYWDWAVLLLAPPVVLVLEMVGRWRAWVRSARAGLAIIGVAAPLITFAPLSVPMLVVGLHLVWGERSVTVLRTMPVAIILATIACMGHVQLGAIAMGGLLIAILSVRAWTGTVAGAVPETTVGAAGGLLIPFLLTPLVVTEMPALNAAMGYSADLAMATVLLLPALALGPQAVISFLNANEDRPRHRGGLVPWVPFLVLVASGILLAFNKGPMGGVPLLYVVYPSGYMLLMAFTDSASGPGRGSSPRKGRWGLGFVLLAPLFIIWAALNPVVYPVYAGMTSGAWAVVSYQRTGLLMLGTIAVAAIMLGQMLRARRAGTVGPAAP